MVLYAPLALLFIKVISHANSQVSISYTTVATSVAAFLGIPLRAAIITRFGLRNLLSVSRYDKVFLKWAAPWSLIGLLFTILVSSRRRAIKSSTISYPSCESPLR
jgi:ACR3 family arsenite transporter